MQIQPSKINTIAGIDAEFQIFSRAVQSRKYGASIHIQRSCHEWGISLFLANLGSLKTLQVSFLSFTL
jgi:hypothetical protein